jgi:hypothetical protein
MTPPAGSDHPVRAYLPSELELSVRAGSPEPLLLRGAYYFALLGALVELGERLSRANRADGAAELLKDDEARAFARLAIRVIDSASSVPPRVAAWRIDLQASMSEASALSVPEMLASLRDFLDDTPILEFEPVAPAALPDAAVAEGPAAIVLRALPPAARAQVPVDRAPVAAAQPGTLSVIEAPQHPGHRGRRRAFIAAQGLGLLVLAVLAGAQLGLGMRQQPRAPPPHAALVAAQPALPAGAAAPLAQVSEPLVQSPRSPGAPENTGRPGASVLSATGGPAQGLLPFVAAAPPLSGLLPEQNTSVPFAIVAAPRSAAPRSPPAQHRLLSERRLAALEPLMEDARHAEQAGDWPRAIEDYAQVAALDPSRNEARRGLDRAASALGRDAYGQSLAQGSAALGAGRLEEARLAFARASLARPNAEQSELGMRRVNAAIAARSPAASLREAARLEEQERWDEARVQYANALAEASYRTLAAAGVERAGAHASLARRMRALLADPQALADERTRVAARELLEQARAQRPQGPRFRAEVARLQQALRLRGRAVPLEDT